MPILGPYSKEIVLAKPDMRTREGRLLRQMRSELARHLGGNLTAPQRALVERAAMLQLRCAVLDQRISMGCIHSGRAARAGAISYAGDDDARLSAPSRRRAARSDSRRCS